MTSPPARCLADEAPAAQAVARGVCRLFFHMDMMSLCEVPLGNGRRADILALDSRGRISLVEIKISLADLRGDQKWPEYLDYCDRYFWAVPAAFTLGVFDDPWFQPERAGLIVADRYDADIVRDAPWHSLPAARRKAETLRFARRAARRVLNAGDPLLAASIDQTGWA